jgi:hypothetical protein
VQRGDDVRAGPREKAVRLRCRSYKKLEGVVGIDLPTYLHIYLPSYRLV